MKVSELIICITISSILVCAGLFAFSTFQRSSANLESSVTSYSHILDMDYFIRKQIKNISLNYWENDYDSICVEKEKLYEAFSNAGINVNDIEYYFDDSNRIEGFIVLWSFDSQEYQTKERLNTPQLIAYEEK